MGILFVVTDTKRKSLVFVVDTGEVLSLHKMAEAAKNRPFEGIYAVTGTSGTYIRSAPDKTTKNNIDFLSVTGPHLVAIAQGHAKSTPAVGAYVERYLEFKGGPPYLKPVGSFRIPRIVVKKVFESHVPTIIKAAAEFNVNRYTLGAIIIDEIARLDPFEPIYEKLSSGIIGRNTSVGVAQVTLETANHLIKAGVYHPHSKDTRLPIRSAINNTDRKILYEYVVQPKYGIRFAAANLRFIIDVWMPYVDLSKRPEILGTLYSKGSGTPNAHPESSERGKQIAGEFYKLAKLWLRAK